MAGDMTAIPMVELWRGGRVESVHSGHAVICDEAGQIVEAWGEPGGGDLSSDRPARCFRRCRWWKAGRPTPPA